MVLWLIVNFLHFWKKKIAVIRMYDETNFLLKTSKSFFLEFYHHQLKVLSKVRWFLRSWLVFESDRIQILQKFFPVLRQCWERSEALLRHCTDIFDKQSWDTLEILLRIPETLMSNYNCETLLRHYWDTTETLLRHYWDSIDTLMRINCNSTLNRDPRILSWY